MLICLPIPDESCSLFAARGLRLAVCAKTLARLIDATKKESRMTKKVGTKNKKKQKELGHLNLRIRFF